MKASTNPWSGLIFLTARNRNMYGENTTFPNRGTSSQDNSASTSSNHTVLLLEQVRIFNAVVPTILAIDTYFLVCLLIFAKRRKKCSASRDARNIFVSCVASTASGIPSCIVQLIAITQWNTHDFRLCEVTADFAAAFTVIAKYSIYAFLRHRQVIINGSPALNKFKKKSWQICNRFHMVFDACMLLASIVPLFAMESRKDCLPIRSSAFSHLTIAIPTIVLVYGIASQLAFSVQFLYPLFKIRGLEMHDTTNCTVLALIHRCLAATFFITFTDIALLIILATTTDHFVTLASSYTIYGVDILVNQIAMLMTFKDFGSILKSPFSTLWWKTRI